MDPMSDQPVEDTPLSGKRKRLSSTESRGSEEWVPSTPTMQQPSVVHQDRTYGVPKKKRTETEEPVASRVTTTSFTEQTTIGCSLLSLPAEVIQRILTYTDPFSLGRMMCLNRYLHDLLDPPKQLPGLPSYGSKLPVFSPDSIWAASRKTYLPGLPHPLKQVSEIEMFRLFYGKRCQKCGALPKHSSSRLSTTPWNSGPGPTGIRAVWPFRVKICADCLRKYMLKETDVIDQGLSDVRGGLLPVSFTPSLNYVMSITLNQTHIPIGLHLTRYYYRPQVEQLLSDASDARALRTSEYRSWSQYLNASRQENLTDVVRLEAWELSQNVANDLLAVPTSLTGKSSASVSSVQSDNVTKSYLTASSGGYRKFLGATSSVSEGSFKVSGSLLPRDNGEQLQSAISDIGEKFQSTGTAAESGASKIQPGQTDDLSLTHPKQDSTDIIRLKGEKRSEIQRRCMKLEPPIPPAILDRLPAFQSALHVLMPLDDMSWDILKPQLLRQRHLIEVTSAAGSDVISHIGTVDSAIMRRSPTPAHEPVSTDLREQAFRPVRDKLYDFAREYVHRRYADGTGVNFSSAPQFAADVIIYVYSRFYQNQAEEDAVFRAHGQYPPDEGRSGIRARRLRLEHMRYVFESSVKPYTEFVRKELFLCSACDTQGRHFAFEAIIQHYASKHTDAFSQGNAVVHWKAEWPAQPPFESTPGRTLDASTTNVHSALSSWAQGLNSEPYPSEGRITHLDSSSTKELEDPSIRTHRPVHIAPIPVQRLPMSSYSSGLSQYSAPHEPVQGMYPTRHRQHRVDLRVSHDQHYHTDDTTCEVDTRYAALQYRRDQSNTVIRPASERHLRTGYELRGGYEQIRDSEFNPYYQSMIPSQPFPTSGARSQPGRDDALPSVRADYNSQYNRSGASIDGLQGNDGALRDVAAQASNSTSIAAERFLDSVDAFAPLNTEKQLSSQPHQPPLSPMSFRDDFEYREVIERRSNMSQPRRRTQMIMDSGNDLYNIDADSSRNNRYHDRSSAQLRPGTHDNRDYSLTHQVRRQQQRRQPPAPPEGETILSGSSHRRYYDDYDTIPVRSEIQSAHHFPRQPRYVDQHGRELDLPSHEVRYIDTASFQQIESRRRYDCFGPQDSEMIYEPVVHSYQEHVRDAEVGTYYVTRPNRDPSPNYRYTRYQQVSARQPIREDNAQYYQQDADQRARDVWGYRLR